MASRSTPKRMQSIESGQREPALFNTHTHTLPTSSLPPVLLTARDSLSLYKVFHNSQVQLEGSGSLSSCLTVSKTMLTARDSLSLYKVFHNSQVQLEGSGSLSSCLTVSKTIRGPSSTSSLKADSVHDSIPMIFRFSSTHTLS